MRAACQPDVVGHPDVPGPPGLDRPDQRADGLLDGGVLVPGVGEPHVDVLGAQPPQRGVELVHQRPPRAVDDPAAVGSADARLGDDHHLVAVRPLQEVTEQVLRRAAGVPVRRVDQGAARRAEGGEQVAGVLGGGAGAPRHRAEAEPRHGQAGGAEAAGQHGGDPIARPDRYRGRHAAGDLLRLRGHGTGNGHPRARAGGGAPGVRAGLGGRGLRLGRAHGAGVAGRPRPRPSGWGRASCRSRPAPRR